jgi:hypothetical protein
MCWPQDLRAQLHRRRVAAAKSLPLACNCRDPYLCACTEPPPTERWVDAGAAAAQHLLEVGLTPILDVAVLQALWRRAGRDRALAQHLYALVGGH